jgi:16S rRNA processing protein RimM
MMGQGSDNERKIILGRISGAHGVKGWLKVVSHTEPREAITDYRPWLLGADEKPYQPLEGARHGKTVIARLENVDDREKAESLAGQDIAVDRCQLPDPGERQFYWADLIGLEVLLEDGESLGTIDAMMATGANDVMVVAGLRQRLIPFIQDQTVLEIDLDSRKITVRWDRDF